MKRSAANAKRFFNSTLRILSAIRHRITPLLEALKDEGYRISWQSNIAMAFVDEVARYRRENNKTNLSRGVVHDIANKAAENFLTALEVK